MQPFYNGTCPASWRCTLKLSDSTVHFLCKSGHCGFLNWYRINLNKLFFPFMIPVVCLINHCVPTLMFNWIDDWSSYRCSFFHKEQIIPPNTRKLFESMTRRLCSEAIVQKLMKLTQKCHLRSVGHSPQNAIRASMKNHCLRVIQVWATSSMSFRRSWKI